MSLRQRPQVQDCCLRVQDVEDGLRARLRSAEGALVPALFSYAAQEFGREFFAEAWDEFFLGNDVPDDIESSKEFGTTFDPFFAQTDENGCHARRA